MNMKPLDWTFDCGVWSATIMGLQLAVVQDADGTYMATCSGGSARPEIQKGFGTPQDARFYAQDTMLRREYQKYFATPEWTEDDVLDGIAEWFSRAVPTPALRNQTVQAGCLFEEAAELAEALGAGCPQIGDLADELKQGVSKFDPAPVPTLDALCDLIVTCVGLAYMMGYDLHAALEVVNASNWSKFEDGQPVFDERGKIQKGKNYRAPSLEAFV